MHVASLRSARVGAAGLVAGGALIGLSAASGMPVPAQVTPRIGTPTTTFALSFVSPVRTGVIGSIRLWYLVSATSASRGKRCLAQISAPAPDGRRGQRLQLALDPAALGGVWCTGTYDGAVRLVQSIVCPKGAMCPTYQMVRGTIARFSLHVA